MKVRDEWGSRDLAYVVKDCRSGKFCLINYTGNSGVVEEVERHFKILGDVIRYLTITLDSDYNYEQVKKQVGFGEEERKRLRELRGRK